MDAGIREQAIIFHCAGETLVGVITHPTGSARRGVLIVVGGPQYRVGSHRQFVLLARALAERGIAAMRFDYRGMGDSTGALRNFEQVSDDIRAALDCFVAAVDGLADVYLWGLCDAASAAMFYAHADRRVRGLVLLNPWVRTESGEAKAYLRHYYLKRAFDVGFWKKALAGGLDVRAAIAGLAGNVKRARSGRDVAAAAAPLPERMADALERFEGRTLLILSGNDLTAREFLDAVQASSRWRNLMTRRRLTRLDIPDANHTFSTRAWRDRVAAVTGDWVLAA